MQSQVLLTMVLEEEEEDVWHAHQVVDRAPRALELVMMVIRLHILRQGVRNRPFSFVLRIGFRPLVVSHRHRIDTNI